MAGENISPNMLLPIPGVGITEGPQYATDVNACLSLIDQHDHTPGKGVQIPTGGLNINAELTFASNNAIDLRSARFVSQLAVLSLVNDLNALYVFDGNLYFNDANGNNVQITEAGGVAGTPGSIAGLVSPASATYVPGTSTFVWQSAANTAANMDFGSAILRNITANSFGMTLNPPNTMAADFSITFPNLPASRKILTLDNSGNMEAVLDVDNATLEIVGNVLRVKDLGITTAKLANASVTTAKLAADISGITISQSQTFTANGTWTVPTGVTNVRVSGAGGGGGSGGGGGLGGTAETFGGAGGNGAPILDTQLITTPGAVLTVVIGAGGTAGTAGAVNGDGGTGGTGGDSSFDTLVFPGGVGGAGGTLALGGGATGLPILGAARGGRGQDETFLATAGDRTAYAAGGANGTNGSLAGIGDGGAGGGGGAGFGVGGAGANYRPVGGGGNGNAGNAAAANSAAGGGGGGGHTAGGGNSGAGAAGGSGRITVTWTALS